MVVPLDRVPQHGEPAHGCLVAVGGEGGGGPARTAEAEAVRPGVRAADGVLAVGRLVAGQLQRAERVRLLQQPGSKLPSSNPTIPPASCPLSRRLTESVL